MRHFSLWYLEVKVHGLITLKSLEVPSNTCPTSLRSTRAIKSFYSTNPSEAEILDQGRITLYKASFFIFLYITAHSRRMTGSDFSFDLLKPFLYSKINKQLKRPFTMNKSSLELTLNAAAEIPHWSRGKPLPLSSAFSSSQAHTHGRSNSVNHHYFALSEFSHLLPNSHFFLSARSRAQNHANLLSGSKPVSQSTSTSWPRGSLAVLTKSLYFRPPENSSAKVNEDSQRISRYDSKFETNPNYLIISNFLC